MKHTPFKPRKLTLLIALLISTPLVLTACGPGTQPDSTDNTNVSRDHAVQEYEVLRQATADQARQQTQKQARIQHKAAPMPMHSAVMGMPAPMLAQAVNTDYRNATEATDRENYAETPDNPIHLVSEDPVSTFSIDVDTGAYTNVRRMLNQGQLPRKDAVRIEEMINYFDYADAAPADDGTPFALHTEVGPTPWNEQTKLLRIGLKAWEPAKEDRPAANLVFLMDVSGSMGQPDKLPLLKRSLRMLSDQLTAEDRVSMVVYAGASGVVLEPTPGDQTAKISQALQELEAGGSTNGGAGIRLAYQQAKDAFIEGGINRVIIATDGDFNVGTVNQQALIDLIEDQRDQGISLTTLGFGSGNYNDALMEQLADHGNGNHAYIDQLSEARKVLVEEMGATLHTVASDVKIQIEFNPAQVAEYRLIGYQNRLLKREDFNNDKVDAGDIGAGHAVTALYEITLKSAQATRIDPLRYAKASPAQPTASNTELAHLKLRYKPVGEKQSIKLEKTIDSQAIKARLQDTSDNYRFAAAVAAFGQQLRGGRYLEGFDYQAIHELAAEARGKDPAGYRGGFLELIRMAASLDQQPITLSKR